MIKFNMSSDISNEFDSFEEDRTIYRSNAKHEHEFIDFLSDCDGINVYPSFNEIENDLIIKKSYKFGLDSSSTNNQEENTKNKFSNSNLLNSNEIKDKSCGVYSKIFTIQREVNNRYLDNINIMIIISIEKNQNIKNNCLII